MVDRWTKRYLFIHSLTNQTGQWFAIGFFLNRISEETPRNLIQNGKKTCFEV